jgi:hypothetical protein
MLPPRRSYTMPLPFSDSAVSFVKFRMVAGQEYIYSEFCVVTQWFFFTSYAYKCFILMNWEQHYHLFPLFLMRGIHFLSGH